MIFDTHTHYDDPAYDSDRNDLLKSFKENNVIGAICASAEYGSIPKIVELCKKYSFLYPTIGIHPSEVEELDEEKWNRLEEYIKEINPVAIGEIGLDYHYGKDDIDLQQKLFIKQLVNTVLILQVRYCILYCFWINNFQNFCLIYFWNYIYTRN